jgi:hypothetical protein
MSMYRANKPAQKLITGYRPVVRAREGLMFGIRQPINGPVFEKPELTVLCISISDLSILIKRFDVLPR